MTTNQAIALAFPLFTAGIVGLTAYGVVRWVEKQRRAIRAGPTDTLERPIDLRAVDERLSHAIDLIQEARRAIEQIRQQH